jgi:hypothetical protein
MKTSLFITPILFSLILNFGIAALADDQPAPEEYKKIPAKMTCDAVNNYGGEDILTAKVKISTDFTGDPFVTVTSSEKLFNIKIGRRNSANQDYSNDKDVICKYRYFKANGVFANGVLGFAYTCNEFGKEPTLMDKASSFAYPNASPSGELCLHFSYRGGMNYCVKLKNCK